MCYSVDSGIFGASYWKCGWIGVGEIKIDINANRKQYTHDLAMQIVKNGSNEEKSELAIALGFDCTDYGFAHIARRFKKLDKITSVILGGGMKNYFKIFMITLIFQIGWVVFIRGLPNIPGISSDILGYGLFLVFPLSIVIDIVLAIKWGNSTKEKLLCIFLMPTNYTWVLMIWVAIWVLKKFMDAMSDFGSSWGQWS
ncbi:MAG: hypothetical protein K2M60_01625 [Lachnospiraceae bacterium]|nr:hypothetical protein [Lachnospiraceae bacterium]MDE6253282.1 hypothetical protein [Lachnospiraceae bacterium]